MRFYKFRVSGLPPKKGGALSMWGTEEAYRVKALREAAAEGFGGAPPLVRGIRLTIRIYVGLENYRQIGDLDTFIAGICDGLMAADPKAKIHSIWDSTRCTPIDPSRSVGIQDDAEVMFVTAEKTIGPKPEVFYEVEIEGTK